MARGTQHRKRRPRENARGGVVAAPAPRKQKPPQWQEQLFFSRLRAHAKWAYIGLAVAFVLSFVVLGVGSGSTGLSDALQSAFHFGSSGGTSIGSLQKKVDKNPKDAAAWRSLATAYEQKQRTQDAVTALQQYTTLRPRDKDALTELAAEYTSLAQTYETQAQEAQLTASELAPATTFQPLATSQLGKAYAAANGLQNPIDAAVQSVADSGATDALGKVSSAARNAESAYERLAQLSPNDATTQLQLGQAAQGASDAATAKAAYTKFLKLAPQDPLAPQVKKTLKSLAASG